MNIINHEAQEIKDPFGILIGNRYEFYLQIDVPEDDELYSEKGIYIRVLFTVNEDQSSIANYTIHEYETDNVLDFELEEEEEKMIAAYCREHLPE
nr:DUF6509 family protein [Peribacillus kribbensis]